MGMVKFVNFLVLLQGQEETWLANTSGSEAFVQVGALIYTVLTSLCPMRAIYFPKFNIINLIVSKNIESQHFF